MKTFTNEHDYFEEILKEEPREKPVVLCKLAYGEIVVGQRANVVPIDHVALHLNNKLAHTSTVLEYDANAGTFVTMNTIYVLVDQESK